ncbi:MAG: DUF3467 domain-containing protein, partial [Planctomycetota bacterium]
EPPTPPPGDPNARKPSIQEIYDDLKLPDEALSGVYANAVMIGHGPTEFALDFLTSFFPQTAVSSRVYLASGQVPRLLDSLKNAAVQLQQRRQQQAQQQQMMTQFDTVNPPPADGVPPTDGMVPPENPNPPQDADNADAGTDDDNGADQ